MSKFPKFRILVGSDERFAELLSLQEKPDGTVTIVPKSAYRIIADDQISKIKKEHISLHTSDLSEGTTIKTTIDSESGSMTSVAFVEDSKRNLVWPIFTRSAADLNNEDYSYTHKRPSEKKIVIFKEISTCCSVLYSVFAQRKGGLFPELKHFSLNVINFERFSVGVYVTNLHVPPTLSSFRSTLVTRHSSIDGRSIGVKKEKGVVGFPWFQLRNVLFLCCERVARIQTRVYLEEFSRNAIFLTPVIIDLLSGEGALISRDPFNHMHGEMLDSKVLPWICDPSQHDDSKEFNGALQSIFFRLDFYNYFSDPFLPYEGEKIIKSKFPFRVRKRSNSN